MILTWLLHAVCSTVFAFLLAHVFNGLSPWIALVSLVLGYFVGRRYARFLLMAFPGWRLLRFHEGEQGIMEIILTVFILYVGFRNFFWLLYPGNHQLSTLAATNFGDLPMHVNFIRAFANGIDFPPRNPIYPMELLRYPYGVDLYNALWESLGVRLQAHLFLVGILATSASLILLRSFAGWYGIGGFFLSGGLAGWQVLSGASLQDFQHSIAWKNIFMAVFLTQRGMLFALPMGLILLMAYRAHLSESAPLGRRGQRILGLIWGFFPLFHLHAFIAVTVLLLALVLEHGGGVRAIASFFAGRMARWAYLPAILLIYHSTKGFQAGSVVHWQFGWTARRGSSVPEFFNYLIQNFGPWLFVPLLIAASLLLSKDIFSDRQRRRLWVEFGLYTGLFFLFFNLMLAPWDWDNIKLLIWPYLGFTRIMWLVVEPRMGALLGFVERPFIAGTLFLSGIVAVTWTLQTPQGHSLGIYRTGDLANTEGALAAVPVNAVFAAAQSHQHSLTYFGRLRAVGYGGHIWSHGIDGQAAADKLEKLLKGDENFRQLANELGVTHIFWGPDERQVYGSNHPAFKDHFANISRVPGYEIYAVK
jgi:hypothetical protein